MDGLDLQLGVHQGYYTQLRTVGTKRNDLDYQLHMWVACGFDWNRVPQNLSIGWSSLSLLVRLYRIFKLSHIPFIRVATPEAIRPFILAIVAENTGTREHFKTLGRLCFYGEMSQQRGPGILGIELGNLWISYDFIDSTRDILSTTSEFKDSTSSNKNMDLQQKWGLNQLNLRDSVRYHLCNWCFFFLTCKGWSTKRWKKWIHRGPVMNQGAKPSENSNSPRL